MLMESCKLLSQNDKIINDIRDMKSNEVVNKDSKILNKKCDVIKR